MKLLRTYKLRLRRRRRQIRAIRKSFDLNLITDNSSKIRRSDTLLFSTIRNEDIRLPYFLEYYRNLGINHFIFVDNDSSDGGDIYLSQQSDVTLYQTDASYMHSRFGMDWLNFLLRKHGSGHWCLTVDPDEFFVFPFCDSRPISALTDWLDVSARRSFGTLLLDMYPKGRIDKIPYKKGENPLNIAPWFDTGNYTFEKNSLFGNIWAQGGPRARIFFEQNPYTAPALNKIPLVKWENRFVYESSTHMLLPRGLNLIYEQNGGEKATGVLLHTKFLDTFAQKAKEELSRNQHYKNSYEYIHYQKELENTPILWTNWSERYVNWRQLEILGLMSKGNWA